MSDPQYDVPPDAARALHLRRPTLRAIAIMIVLGAVAGGIGGLSVLSRPKVYESEAALLADQPNQVFQSHDDGVIRKLGALRLKYRDLIRTSLIAAPAAQALGMNEHKVESEVSGVLQPQSLILIVRGRSHNNAEASRVANGVAVELDAYIDREQADQNIAPAQRFLLRRLGGASVARKVLPTSSHVEQVGFASGALVLAIAFVIDQLVRNRRSA